MNIILATDIKPLLNNNYAWRMTDGALLATRGLAVYRVSDGVLRSYHEDLPLHLCRAFAFFKDTFAEESIGGYVVHVTLQYLQYGPIKLAVDGNPVLFGAVSKLEKNAAKPDMLDIEGTHVRLEDVEYEGELVEAIICGHTVIKTIPKAVLDSAYPSWDTRLEVANALGLDGDDLYNYVFHSKKVNSHPTATKLSSVQFDV